MKTKTHHDHLGKQQKNLALKFTVFSFLNLCLELKSLTQILKDSNSIPCLTRESKTNENFAS